MYLCNQLIRKFKTPVPARRGYWLQTPVHTHNQTNVMSPAAAIPHVHPSSFHLCDTIKINVYESMGFSTAVNSDPQPVTCFVQLRADGNITVSPNDCPVWQLDNSTNESNSYTGKDVYKSVASTVSLPG